MKIINIIPGSEEWTHWRSCGLGASDAAAILGVSPFKTKNQLWKEKILGVRQPDNAAMERGRALEPIAADFFMAQTGIFIESQKMYEHPERNWMRATMDGVNEEEKVLVEIKSCRSCHDVVPAHYYPQLQHQMEVIGYDKMFYVSFDGINGKILEVEKDEEYVKELVKKEEEFWNLIQKGCQDMEDNVDWKEISERYKSLKSVKEGLKEEEAFLISQFILFADGIPSSGNGVLLQRKERKGSIDYNKIVEDYQIDLERYRKEPTNYWSIDLKKVDEK